MFALPSRRERAARAEGRWPVLGTAAVPLALTSWGEGPHDGAIVLLHGMLSSADYWTDVATRISGRRVLALDLLGFGSSPRPRWSDYTYDDHGGAIVAALEASKVRGPITLVGHSMGALIALRLAAERPEVVRSLVLTGMPIFESKRVARAVLGRLWIGRRLLYGTTSRAFCSVWCQRLKPISRRMAPPPPGRASGSRSRNSRAQLAVLLTIAGEHRRSTAGCGGPCTCGRPNAHHLRRRRRRGGSAPRADTKQSGASHHLGGRPPASHRKPRRDSRTDQVSRCSKRSTRLNDFRCSMRIPAAG